MLFSPSCHQQRNATMRFAPDAGSVHAAADLDAYEVLLAIWFLAKSLHILQVGWLALSCTHHTVLRTCRRPSSTQAD